MKYKNLLFTPIDIDIPILDFKNINVTHSKPTYSPFWDYEQLLKNPDPYRGSNEWRTDLDESRIVLKNIILQLPLIDLYNVRLTVQTLPVTPHVDVNQRDTPPECYQEYTESEPCGYRIVLKGTPSSLKIHKSGKLLTAHLPNVPGIYLINSTSCVHSVFDDIGRITVYIRGRIDKTRHLELIEKSLKKYQQDSIFSL